MEANVENVSTEASENLPTLLAAHFACTVTKPTSRACFIAKRGDFSIYSILAQVLPQVSSVQQQPLSNPKLANDAQVAQRQWPGR